eukprot:NODE_4237_length_839_cov_102.379747_g3911_i0.p2 GENE.NODE_4237_length_839_cov_102.379747_g3911_i0~~NODE_4237_length_839_cov_102.379747_g3911_i0.p2  ORF type:complete len:192 (-),score=43.20 NODE_4237_length_839_cov_102.379747_g3911_i0:198-773(-)
MFAARFATRAARPFAVRAYSEVVGKKYDLFGYEVSTNTAPYIEKIQKTQYYDDAGEVIVAMNLNNTPPDLTTYNALLERILNAKSKQSTPVDGENRFCAMMDVLEEMDHRYGIRPDAQSWGYVMQELVTSGDFRMGWLCIEAMRSLGVEPSAELIAKNSENSAKAKSSGVDFPPALRRSAPEDFDTKAWGL